MRTHVLLACKAKNWGWLRFPARTPQSVRGHHMVTLVVGATNPNARGLLAKMFRQRHQVFVEEKGWKLKSYNGIEFDSYDTDETVYLMALTPDGEMAAS